MRRVYFSLGASRVPWANEELVRAELFSAERLELHAESLAHAQVTDTQSRRGLSLSHRLRENDRVLRDAYVELARALASGHRLSPAAQRLVDNYHVVAEQVSNIRADLPPGYYRQLPKLASGPLAGYPRIMGLAWDFVAHTDSHFDPQILMRFVRAYQRVNELTIGELWALAITLRVVLVENLRRAARRILEDRHERQRADLVADAILSAASGEAAVASLPSIIARIPRGPLHPTFAVQLVARLREQDPAVTPALVWLDQRLATQGTNADTVVQQVHHNQAAMTVTVRNIIISMRMISASDWLTFFESVSTVDALLRERSDFAQMDFPTRNRYRTAIENLARFSPLSEADVVRRALLEAEMLGHQGLPETISAAQEMRRDPGYYLIDEGRTAFEAAIGYTPPLSDRPRRIMRRLGMQFYLGATAAVSLAIGLLGLLGLPAPSSAGDDFAGWWVLAFGVVAILPTIDAASSIVNRLVTLCLRPAPLPGMALRQGVPESLRTIVAVPTMLTTPDAITEQIERLEIHYLACPDGELFFALVTDWTDAAEQSRPDDEALLSLAAEGIERLNERYARPASGSDRPRFMLLHRRRLWNASQKAWMGWERKRGKLHELNRLLRGCTDTNFIPIRGAEPSVPDGIRYVITLDQDTRLPRGAVSRLIGKMAHRLNKPVLDTMLGRVVSGYGILQPRVTPSLPMGREGTIFQKVFSSGGGIDPYAAATSDVYQDLFDEGSFAGKGIYDVDVFAAAIQGRVPQDTMLSHDLFEGIFARAGLASDIELVEAFPGRYDVTRSRQHRWTRGDWQLLPWILGPRARTVPYRGWWKMLDNLRRSVTPPAIVVALLLCCQLPLSQALYCALFVLLPVMLPPLLPVIGDLWPTHAAVGLLSHSRMLANDLRAAGNQIALQVVLIAEQASTMADAIVRTLIRLFVTHRNLLEWTTHEQAQASLQSGLAGYYRRMPGTLVLAAACAGTAFSRSSAWPLSTALAALWFLAPAIAYWASTANGDQEEEEASPEALRALRLIGRRTWRFFETFVTPEDNMLPPDNFQEDPKPVIAHRTSPTNIGLYLLSVASAHDLGWLSLLETVDRIEACFATLDKLERINGHFLNWYDTTDLRPLSPKYVSSVDSGNLAGHLIALANACEAWIEQPVIGARMGAGIQDTIELARQSLEGDGATMGSGPAAIVIGGISADLDALQAIFTAPYGELASAAAISKKLVAALATLNCPNQAAISAWIHAIEGCISGHAGDLAWLFPVAMPSYDNQSSPTLRALTANGLTSPSGGARAHDLCRRLTTLAQRARTFAESMDFEFLLDKERRLLSIGFLPSEGTLDGSCYDLLASEARLASFFAIAKSDVPVSHWFRLGRSMVPIGEGAALISWSGSMFEYLMPSLIMRAPQFSLLASTNRMIVQHQIDYASSLGLPWGMSESAFSARDLEMTYQYSNFGVPDLALKRGLSEQAVIAPYATALAAMVAPAAAVTNFGRLAAAGGLGSYGYFEALDYTRARLPAGETVSVVRAYMAHHQGMSIVAICNAVLDGIVRTRFHAEPLVQANELLLQERAPREVMRAQERPEDLPAADPASAVSSAPACRRIHSPHDAAPATHILSNGRYSVMLTASGSGYSRWQGLAVTRWREDPTLDDWGSYIFIRDVGSDRIWSAGYLPSGMEADSYTVTFHEERAEILRRDGPIMSHLEIVVSAEDDAEVRRLTLTNTGAEPLELEVTSFAELVLASPADDDSHPAFSKMFVQTEFLPELGTLLATRRRRAPAEPEIWAAHLLVLEGKAIGDLHMETDRAAFIGRGRDTRNPAAMAAGRPLSGTVGTVLDPIFSLRRRLQIEPGGSARLAFWTVVASSRADALSLADRHRDSAAFDRALTLAWTQAQVQLRHLGIAHAEAGLFQRLAGHLLYSNALLRPPSDILLRCGSQGQAGLWAHGISGDLPILLIRIDVVADMELIRRLLAAHEYWRLKQLAVDIVILNEKSGSYLGELQDLLEAALRIGQTRTAVVQGVVRGSVYVLRPDIIGSEATAQLMSVARAVLVSRRGPLDEQFEQLDAQKRSRPMRPIRLAAPPAAGDAQGEEPPPLEFFNGIGGFTKHGREYVVLLRDGRTTPAPWSNVIANDAFGFLCTAEGGGYSWWRNSRENQITAWSNDPVSDRPSDVVYVRDEETGAIFGPTASPARIRNADYTVHHGMGYSRFRARIFEIDQDLLSFVPEDDPVKVARLTLRNTSERPRRLSVTWYLEWNLGPSRSSAAHIQTEHDRARHAILARNPWNTALGPMVAFAAMPDRNPAVTGDRREFLGRNGTLAQPAALCRALPLSNRTGAGFDPCAALQVQIELLPGEATEVTLLLGAADSAEGAGDLLSKYAAADIDQLLAAVQATWDGIIGGTQVTTPDRSLDVMLNGWLLYQSLGCRTWARAGFYQASGAYGFRDQLQDGMAIVLARPDLARAHLVRAAGRQFPEGDVQHWWLPPQGRGVRTRIVDDRAWLAFATLRYMTVTGDSTLLSDAVPFLDGPVLPPHDQEAYFLPSASGTSASVYEHCAVGLDSSLTTGPHGLPLFGSGDWNDGMNRIGAGGSGESVWMAWFLHTALTGFAPIAEAKGDTDRAARWRAHAAELHASVERSAWDGNWYRRGYYDDGTPLGSVASSECRIDSIAQSWAVISGAGQPERAARAMGAVDDHLMRRQDGLALLFTPPFDHTPLDPGYIKGYPPGLRENGGQYTHAGAWAVIALTLLGEADRACELFAMMNPINHALTAADAHRYKVEPYVMAADVYAAPGHVGRGGWTWYTGSAAWMYRAGLEHVLGCRREAGWLRIEPCIPASWPGYEVKLQVGPNMTIISVQNPQAVSAGVHQAWLDDIEIFERPLRIALAADGRDHHLRVVLGEAPILGTE